MLQGHSFFKFLSQDSSGYWTKYEIDSNAGVWIKADGSDNGIWRYDDDSETTGTW